MSDRLGRGNFWEVFKAVGTDHHPACSAEIGDSGALIIRHEAPNPHNKPGLRAPVENVTRWIPSKVYQAHAWVYLIACEAPHEAVPG